MDHFVFGFFKWANPSLFLLILVFSSCQNSNIIWLKHKWCAWESNPEWQYGRRRRIHWAMAAPLDQFVYWHEDIVNAKNSSGTIKINYQFRYSHFIPSFIPSLGVRGREKRRCGVLAEWERRKIKKKKLTNWRNLVDSSSRVFLFSPLPHSAKRQPLHHSLSLFPTYLLGLLRCHDKGIIESRNCDIFN